MIKRISVFALSLLLLFSFVSCEGDTLKSIGKFMNGMGNSVVRPDTSSVNNVSQSAESAEKTEVGSAESTVSVVAKINGINAADLTKISETEQVSVVLKSLDEESKNELIVNINASISNSAGKDKLVSDMSATVEGDAKTAAQGTATVMNNALSAIQGLLLEENNAIKTVADSLSLALSKIASAEEVSKADVVTLQLIDSFVNTVAGSLDTTGSSVTIDNNQVSDIISEANTMVTVASALSPASQFKILDFSDLISSLIGSRDLSESDLVIDGIKSKYIEIGLRVYDEINAIISKDSYNQAISALRLHKAAYETMVATTDLLKNNASVELNNKVGNNLNAFIQYIVASAIVEADNLYGAVYNAVGKPEGIPDTVIGVLADIYSYNKENNGFSEKIIIPEKYIKLKESITNDMLTKIETEAYKALNINGVNTNMTIVTINKVLKAGLKLDSILSGVDLDSVFSDATLEELIGDLINSLDVSKESSV